MGSGASQQQASPDNMAILYANKKQTSIASTQTTGPSVATNTTQTDAVAIQTGSDTKATGKPEVKEQLKESDNESVVLDDSFMKMAVKDGLEDIRKYVKKLQQRKEFVSDEAVKELLFFRNLTQKLDTKEKRDKCLRYVDEMAQLKVMDTLVKAFRACSSNVLNAKTEEDNSHQAIKSVLAFLVSASRLSVKICEEIRRCELYKDLFALLDKPQLKPQDGPTSSDYAQLWGDFIVPSMLTTLHNCVRTLDMRDSYRNCDAIRILDIYQKCSNPDLCAIAELTFAWVVTEKEMLIENTKLDFYKQLLQRAVDNKDKSDEDLFGLIYREETILDALNHLAAHDKNKARFAEHGFLPFYVMYLDEEKCSEKELVVATKGLYLMAFRAQEKMKQTPGCVESKWNVSFYYLCYMTCICVCVDIKKICRTKMSTVANTIEGIRATMC